MIPPLKVVSLSKSVKWNEGKNKKEKKIRHGRISFLNEVVKVVRPMVLWLEGFLRAVSVTKFPSTLAHLKKSLLTTFLRWTHWTLLSSQVFERPCWVVKWPLEMIRKHEVSFQRALKQVATSIISQRR